MEEWRFCSFLIVLLIIQMEIRLAPHPLIFKSHSSGCRISSSVGTTCPPIGNTSHHVIPTHGCICCARQNEKYWELPGEIRQKILGNSGVLHIFPVTLVKRDLVWELDTGCSWRPFEYVLGLHWSGTNYPAEDSRMSEFNGQNGF